MANLPETSDFVSGIYQIEQTDPVLGGPPNEATGAGMTNIPAQQLAKRTRWLKDNLDSVLAQLAANPLSGFAPINSPAFTGTPTAPTQAQDNNTTRVATTAFVIGQAGTASPNADGVAAVGTSLRYARQDHRHPTDTSRAPIASPAFTGTPTAPTPAADNNSTAVATTAFVIGQAGTALPNADGVAAAGTSLRYARQDHRHPADTSRAPIASPIFTGDPRGPTPAQFDNGTSLATTAFVQRAIGSNSSAVIVTANRTMTAADAGRYLFVSGSNLTITLPNPSGLPLGTSFRIAQGSATSGGSINTPSGVTIGQVSGGPNVTTLPLDQRAEYVLTVVSSTAYQVTVIGRAPEAPGAAPVYACRAWVNFNGHNAATIRSSGNVSSVTRAGVGLYTVNFTAAMPDENYVMAGSHRRLTTTGAGSQPMGLHIQRETTPTTSSISVESVMNNVLSDSAFMHVAIFR